MKKEVIEIREAIQKMRNWGYAKARRGPSLRGGRGPFTGVLSMSELMGVLISGAANDAPLAEKEGGCSQYTPSVKRGVKNDR